MQIKNVIVELRRRPDLEAAHFGAGLLAADMSVAVAAVSPVAGLTLDPGFAPVVVPRLAPAATRYAGAAEAGAAAAAAAAAEPSMPDFDGDTVLLRGVLDESVADAGMFAAGPQDGVVGVFSDPVIEPTLICGGSPPLGDVRDVARLLDAARLRKNGMDGRGVMVAIVDTGVNLPYLTQRLGWTPAFSPERSWTPPLQPGQPALTPGRMPVGHGTMCAYDALIAAPKATLLDVAVLASRRPGGSAMDGLLSDAVLGYSHLLRLMRGLGRPGDFRSLVVNNSWGMFQRSWDFPPGHPGNYSDNPAHPFNRIVATLERAGADILFAAGNCGRECPDNRCGAEQDAGVFGANSHPAVLCVAGVDVRKRRVGYSTRGPGLIEPRKPDVACFTHFAGSGVYPADGGTSAATPVAAGLLAAFRSRFPTGPERTPAMLRDLVRRTAEAVGGEAGAGEAFNEETGFGVISGGRLASSTMAGAAEDDAHDDRAPGDRAPGGDAPDGMACADDSPEGSGGDEAGDEPMTDDDDAGFLRALREFGFAGGGGASAFAGEGGPTGREPCGCCDACGGVSGARETMAMNDDDYEFEQALRAFGYQGGAAAGMGAAAAGMGGFAAGADDFGDADDFDEVDGGDDQEFMQALAAFGGPAAGGGGFAAGVDAAAAPSVAAVCRVWRSVRSIVMRIIPFIGAIPGIGSALATALRTLARLLDAVCRGGSVQNLCRTWRGGLRTVVVRVASVVRRIPFIGRAAGRAIRTLIGAIDAVCRGV